MIEKEAEGGYFQGHSTGAISAADGQRDGSASSFMSSTPLELIPMFTRGWREEEWEVGRNRVQELTKTKL